MAVSSALVLDLSIKYVNKWEVLNVVFSCAEQAENIVKIITSLTVKSIVCDKRRFCLGGVIELQ